MRIYESCGEQYLVLDGSTYGTSAALVKQKFKMLEHWAEEARRLEKENAELRLQLEHKD